MINLKTTEYTECGLLAGPARVASPRPVPKYIAPPRPGGFRARLRLPVGPALPPLSLRLPPGLPPFLAWLNLKEKRNAPVAKFAYVIRHNTRLKRWLWPGFELDPMKKRADCGVLPLSTELFRQSRVRRRLFSFAVRNLLSYSLKLYIFSTIPVVLIDHSHVLLQLTFFCFNRIFALEA